MRAKLVHENGAIKDIKVGYSWTTFLFGFWVPAIRGQWPDFAIILISAVPTIGILPFIWTFKINKRYCQHLLEKGYKPASQEDLRILNTMDYCVRTQSNAITE
ncbi:DUF2628 domain-containing protein [Candidatus Clostridium stratigraminis]|uniref:DUF2628 domain-containing protein n=1 Tax=Candidatus Clostridium stratigraminis TaxID=3381661 RepID=A0ABW8T1Q5_9CLOT